jgi:phosphoribosylformimino-5-aminoimidazole carboxamide ribotide isomerase
MHITPAIDIFEGRCVRLKEGNFSNLTDYVIDPQEMVKKFIHAGAKYLHVVDLEGAKSGHIVNWKTIEEILAYKEIETQVGGGIRNGNDVKKLLSLGATRVVVGSVAVKSPHVVETWVKEFGADKFCIALDVKNGNIAFNGWQEVDGATIASVVQQMQKFGIKRFLSTDVEKDGMLSGPNLDLYRSLVKEFPDIEWIASGGVRSIDDILALAATGVAGVVIGKALYENKIRLEEIFH